MILSNSERHFIIPILSYLSNLSNFEFSLDSNFSNYSNGKRFTKRITEIVISVTQV